MVLEADEFESDDDLQEAYYRYKKAAELGNKDGMYNLGLYYLNGIYVEQDDKMALLWLERAAEKGHSDAANDIGVYYHNSKNLRGKHFKAIKWYKRGAELGNKYSQCNLGWHYEYGMGCEVDLSLAKKYADKVILLDRKVIKEGTPDEVFSSLEFKERFGELEE